MANISIHHHASELPLQGTFTAYRELFALWRRRAEARRELATLDLRTIRDLGLDLGQIRFEANKPFWRT